MKELKMAIMSVLTFYNWFKCKDIFKLFTSDKKIPNNKHIFRQNWNDKSIISYIIWKILIFVGNKDWWSNGDKKIYILRSELGCIWWYCLTPMNPTDYHCWCENSFIFNSLKLDLQGHNTKVRLTLKSFDCFVYVCGFGPYN